MNDHEILPPGQIPRWDIDSIVSELRSLFARRARTAIRTLARTFMLTL